MAGLVTAFLVDSDVLIDVLRRHRQFEPAADDDVAISVVTRTELLAGRSAEDLDLEQFLAPYDEIDVDGTIATTAGVLRRTIGLAVADAIIAATALTMHRVLLTRNLRDFGRVGSLRTRSPGSPDDQPDQ